MLLACAAGIHDTGAARAAAVSPTANIPRRLSETKIFRDLTTLEPSAGVIPYDVNAPFWSDGAFKRRWIVLPGDGTSVDPTRDRIIVKPGLPWAFPTGTLFVKHFDWVPDESNPSRRQRLETRVIVRDKDGGVYGFTYKWNADGTDATLLDTEASDILTVRSADGSMAQQRWDYPSPDQCLVCHNPAAGGVLGVSYRQLDRWVRYADSMATVGQIAAWNRAGMISKSLDEAKALDPWNLMRIPAGIPVPFWSVPRLGRLTPPQDQSASLETRARSYLDANCSYCHAPGIVTADWDARMSTPLAEQQLIDRRARNPKAGATYVVKPGAPEESLLYLRVRTIDPELRMPPLARNRIDEAGSRLLADWIMSLAPSHAPQKALGN